MTSGGLAKKQWESALRAEYGLGNRRAAERDLTLFRPYPRRVGQHERGDGSARIGAVRKLQAAPVRFDDLARQDQPDTAASRLRGEERHEEVVGIRDTRPIVRDGD